MLKRSSSPVTPNAPQLRVVRVKRWYIDIPSTGNKRVVGYMHGHASLDEGAYAYVTLSNSVDATKIGCGYKCYLGNHLIFLLENSRDDEKKEFVLTSEMVNVPKLTTNVPTK